jgi:hypothetical protein
LPCTAARQGVAELILAFVVRFGCTATPCSAVVIEEAIPNASWAVVYSFSAPELVYALAQIKTIKNGK